MSYKLQNQACMKPISTSIIIIWIWTVQHSSFSGQFNYIIAFDSLISIGLICSKQNYYFFSLLLFFSVLRITNFFLNQTVARKSETSIHWVVLWCWVLVLWYLISGIKLELSMTSPNLRFQDIASGFKGAVMLPNLFQKWHILDEGVLQEVNGTEKQWTHNTCLSTHQHLTDDSDYLCVYSDVESQLLNKTQNLRLLRKLAGSNSFLHDWQVSTFWSNNPSLASVLFKHGPNIQNDDSFLFLKTLKRRIGPETNLLASLLWQKINWVRKDVLIPAVN